MKAYSFIFALVLFSSPSYSKELTFSDARSMAIVTESMIEFRPFVYKELTSFYQSFGQKAINECMSELNIESFPFFSVVARITNTGEVNRTWGGSGTSMEKCYSDKLKNAKFPQPPFSPYYTWVEHDAYNPPNKWVVRDAAPLRALRPTP